MPGPGTSDFFIVGGDTTSILTTPLFSTIGLSTAWLVFNQAYNLNGAIAKVEISTAGGAAGSYTTLLTYVGAQGPTNGMTTLSSFNLNAYLGRSNLMIRFYYSNNVSGSGTWALDNVVVTNSVSNPSGVGALNPLTYFFCGKKL